MLCLLVFVITAFLAVGPIVHCDQEIKNHEIYKLRNRHDLTFLTAINVKTSNPPVVLDAWRDAATQKFRAVKAYTSAIYQFIPTSDETRALSMDSKQYLVAQETIHWFFGLSNQEYWEVKNVGSGYSQLKNYKTEKCLTGLGTSLQVGVSPCENSFRQQWEIAAV